MSGQLHRSDPVILGRRTLRDDHRCLARVLSSGLSVLDIGCGTGAITAGIAEAVEPEGRVIGVDRDEGLLAVARAQHAAVVNLAFEHGEADGIPYEARFDVVSCARTLQWIAEPERAFGAMKRAAKPGGLIVLLDYNHLDNGWAPEPPEEFQMLYQAFLSWRQANGWDNRMGDHLAELCKAAVLVDVHSESQDEISERGARDFAEKTALWPAVFANLEEQLQASGVCSSKQIRESIEKYDRWREAELMKQTLSMRAATARKPG